MLNKVVSVFNLLFLAFSVVVILGFSDSYVEKWTMHLPREKISDLDISALSGAIKRYFLNTGFSEVDGESLEIVKPMMVQKGDELIAPHIYVGGKGNKLTVRFYYDPKVEELSLSFSRFTKPSCSPVVQNIEIADEVASDLNKIINDLFSVEIALEKKGRKDK